MRQHPESSTAGAPGVRAAPCVLRSRHFWVYLETSKRRLKVDLRRRLRPALEVNPLEPEAIPHKLSRVKHDLVVCSNLRRDRVRDLWTPESGVLSGLEYRGLAIVLFLVLGGGLGAGPQRGQSSLYGR